MRTLGIIPARGGSKGLPRKNVLPLHGKPLIAWTIEQVRASTSLDLTVVSTDDEEIAEIARRFGGHVPFLRPTELAQDDTPIVEVVRHLLVALEPEHFDVVALLQPTSPMRRPGDIDGALRLLAERYAEADGVISVGDVHTENAFICKVIDGEFIKPVVGHEPPPYQRQRAKPVYYPYGVIYAAKTHLLLEHSSFYQERSLPFFLERWQNYDLDDLCDFLCVETIMRHKMAHIETPGRQ